MNIRRWIGIATLALFSSGITNAEVFQFKYFEGERYRVRSVVDEEVYINGLFSHRADILNKISIEVTKVEEGAGYIEALFQTSERAYGSGEVYEWGNDYTSQFWRNEHGEYDIEPFYFMPVVRDVPRYTGRDIEIGESWSLPGEEVHDLRSNFGVDDAFHFPINVTYRYLGKRTLEEREYDLITIDYAVFFKPNIALDEELYPTRITGFSSQKLYWDNENGKPYSYSENFDFVFTLSSGDTVEYIGTAEAMIIESERMDKEKVAEEIRNQLDEMEVQDTEVTVSEEGVTVTIENIQFLPDSFFLEFSEREKLSIIGDILRQHGDRDILITGHTALAGTAAGRQQLSEERAQAVGNYLLSLGAIDENQLITRGKGAREPIADNDTERSRRRNRRVEIVILEN